MNNLKYIFILGLLTLIVLCSFTLEIVTFDNIMEILTAIKAILFQLKIINYKGMIIKPNVLALNIIPLFVILFYILTACITFIYIYLLFIYLLNA